MSWLNFLINRIYGVCVCVCVCVMLIDCFAIISFSLPFFWLCALPFKAVQREWHRVGGPRLLQQPEVRTGRGPHPFGPHLHHSRTIFWRSELVCVWAKKFGGQLVAMVTKKRGKTLSGPHTVVRESIVSVWHVNRIYNKRYFCFEKPKTFRPCSFCSTIVCTVWRWWY